MEIDYKKVNIIKNVRMIAYTLIAIHMFGLYQSFGGMNSQRDTAMQLKAGAQISQYLNLSFLPWYIGVIVIATLLISIVIIYNAVLLLQFNEKGRFNLSRVLLVYIVFLVISFIFNTFFMMDFTWGYQRIFSSSFLVPIAIFAIFTFTMSMLNYLFYRFLNKPDTKAVFTEAGLNN